MSDPDGPEQREADAQERSEFEYDELDRIERREGEQVDEVLLEHDAVLPKHTWMRNDGIDAISWPKAIIARPVNTDHLEAQARRILERMADES